MTDEGGEEQFATTFEAKMHPECERKCISNMPSVAKLLVAQRKSTLTVAP